MLRLPDLEGLGSLLGGLLFVGAAAGALYLGGRMHGRDAERAVWQERQIVAERAARQTEQDLAALAEQSARRIAVKEAALNEQARRQTAAWRQALAAVPLCRIPAAVGVQLDAAAGVPETPAVAGAPGAGPAALDAGPTCAEQLDAARNTLAVCAGNVGRLIEARDWYEAIRGRLQ